MPAKTDLSDVLDLLGETISADEEFARYAEQNPLSAFDEILVKQKQQDSLIRPQIGPAEIQIEPLSLEELSTVCGG